MNLRDIKLVDMRKSVLDTSQIDKLKEELKKAKKDTKKYKELEEKLKKAELQHKRRLENRDYKFKKKVYIDPRWFIRNPDLKFKWGTTIRDNEVIKEMKMDGWDFVTEDDPIWAEGAIVDQEGHYTFKDAVLMKIPLQTYVDQIKERKALEKRRMKAVNERFKTEARKYGAVGFGGKLEEGQDIEDYL